MTTEQGDAIIAALGELKTHLDAIGQLLALVRTFAEAGCTLLLVCIFFLCLGRRAA